MKKQTFASKKESVKSLTDKELAERYRSRIAFTTSVLVFDRGECASIGMQDSALLNLYREELYNRVAQCNKKRIEQAALPDTSIEEIEQFLNERDFELYQQHHPAKVPYDSDPEYVLLSEILKGRKEK